MEALVENTNSQAWCSEYTDKYPRDFYNQAHLETLGPCLHPQGSRTLGSSVGTQGSLVSL